MRNVVPLVVLIGASIVAFLGHAVILDSGIKNAIALKVSPQVSMGPTTLQIEVRVKPLEEDRWIRVELSGADFSRASEFDVTSDQPIYAWALKDVQPGDYEAWAGIGHGGTVRASDRVRVIVWGR